MTRSGAGERGGRLPGEAIYNGMMMRFFRRAGLGLIVLTLLAGQAGTSEDEPTRSAPAEPARVTEPAATESPATESPELDEPSGIQQTPLDESRVGEPDAQAPPTTPGPAAPAKTPPAPRLSSLPSGANVAVIPVQGMIYEFTFESLERRVQRALARGASVIVLEIDTYGGVLTAALEISKFLKDPTRVPVPTVAWINDKAYSAGIMIAAACDEIVMHPSSATGDCAPIAPGQNLSPTERAKAYSPVATEFRGSARAHGYEFATFDAMCRLGIDLYLIEHPDTGQRLVVNQADYAAMVRGDSAALGGLPVDVADQDNGGASGGGVFQLPGGVGGPATGGPSEDVTQAQAVQARPDELGRWRPVTVLPSGQSVADGRVHRGEAMLFTPDATLAQDIGLSRATVADEAALSRYLGAASLTRVDQTWSENLAAFLTGFWVRAILIVLLAVGAYLELQAPGLGIPAVVALLALLGLFGAPMIIGLADIWHVLLFAAGLGLLIIEVLTAATFGALGVVGVILMLASLVLAVVPTSGGVVPATGTLGTATTALLTTMVAFVVSAVGVGLMINYFGKIPGLNRLILADEAGTLAPAGRLAGEAALGGGQIRVGQIGTVVSTLRPSGEAEFGDQTVDVVSVGPMIDRNARVRVLEVQRFTIIVEEVEDGDASG